MANALYQTLGGLDVKTARGSNGNTAYIGADFFALSHHGLHTITRLKAMNPLFSGLVASWKAKAIQAGALVAAATGGFND